ncbi:hypothetical protein [Pseudomonas parakoreensis]|uniref:hypothetical protein n=1 Tax=Pseudomonas parakoreensis TaxID=2892331 RepID=UPI001F477B57|nr:hypothetical protein [Pseudomonas parakoreensis]
MTSHVESTTDISAVSPTTAEVFAGPWPNYSNCRHLPERDRWEMYRSAKALRQALEDQGLVMAEGYDAFIRRVTGELDL